MCREMKYLFVLTVFFLTALLLPCQPGAKEGAAPPAGQEAAESTDGGTPAGNAPRLVIDAPEYDAGEVPEGEKITHAFSVKNTGTAELSIQDVKAG